VLVMDEAGVEIDKEAGLIISVDARFQQEIYPYLKENQIDVYIV
jgi:hypothetical protein